MIEIRSALDEELHQILTLVLNRPGLRAREVKAQVKAFLSGVGGSRVPPEGLWVATEGKAIVCGAFCVDSPGKTSLVFIPAMSLHVEHQKTMEEVLRRLLQAGGRRGIRMFQAMVPPEAEEDADLLRVCGFQRLAELIYLERLSTLPIPSVPEASGIQWIPYDRSNHGLFAEVIRQTYVNSLDCPRLAGLRDIEDVIEGHKASGEFDPHKWFLVKHLDEYAGCLLLSSAAGRSGLEVVYMGLVPAFRGRGLGGVLLAKVMQLAFLERVAYVTVAVDASNEPACNLYVRTGFHETLRRVAWILTLNSKAR